jgi:hypothetical protein
MLFADFLRSDNRLMGKRLRPEDSTALVGELTGLGTIRRASGHQRRDLAWSKPLSKMIDEPGEIPIGARST